MKPDRLYEALLGLGAAVLVAFTAHNVWGYLMAAFFYATWMLCVFSKTK